MVRRAIARKTAKAQKNFGANSGSQNWGSDESDTNKTTACDTEYAYNNRLRHKYKAGANIG